MNIDRIRMFVAVCLYGTVSKAADSLFISQPAISQGIKGLEKELGVSLFSKKGRNLHLTTEGTNFLPLANNLIDAYTLAVERFKSPTTQELTIGCSVTIATYLLPEIIARYREEFAKSVTVIVDNVATIKQLLADNQIDLGLIEGPANNQAFLYRSLTSFELVFVASPDYLKQPRQTFSDYDFLIREKGSSYRTMFDTNYLLQKNRTITPKWVSYSNEALKQAALYHQGVALLPAISVTHELEKKQLEVIQFDRTFPQEEAGIIVNQYRSSEPLLQEFIAFCKNNS